jgi:radical SAM protein with 4Fe4S-binding SPASM domain
MRRFEQIKSTMSHVALNAPRLLSREFHTMLERTGDFTDALDISKKRLLAVFFETTDFCNARCIMCGAKQMRRKRQTMPMNIYQMAVEQFAQANGHSTMLSAFGEPLLDPHVIERVAFARKFPTIKNIGFSTNGSLLTAKEYRALAEAGLTSLSISVDGFSKETYERVRVGLSFETLGENISEMLTAHKAMGRPIHISVSSFTAEKRKNLVLSPLYNALLEAGITPGLKWRVDNWGGLVSDVNSRLHLIKARRHHGPCALLYHAQALVLPDGRVTPCHCRDLEGNLYIGDINKSTLSEIWSGQLLEELRNEQLAGKFRPPCDLCSAYIPLKSWFTRSMSRWIVAYDKTVPMTVDNLQQIDSHEEPAPNLKVASSVE